MSALKSRIQEDIKTAMKARAQLKLLTLRGVMAEVKTYEIDSHTEVSEEKLISIVQKEIKKRRDTLKYAEEANRQDLIDQNNSEIAVLQQYLGEQLSEEGLRQLIMSLIENGSDNLGKIMGQLSKDYKGKFDGKLASDIARTLLG